MAAVATASNNTAHTAPAPAHAHAHAHAGTVPAPGSARPQHYRAPRTDGYLKDAGSALPAITPDANVITPDANGAAYV
ncbi:hypothetical protein OG564_45720 [Streptomyces sp. NBC_01280]|uniref:hypothetical protein n=1 Tax=Streptomyces sp. NBC_01280 TaxID=2903810 RepID=UPI002E2FDD11|nr:hypothetical protein [Streptomyces sp. NBC_01280]WSE11939.1 hypothetical protein OG518_00475 [Streptomyces sp. NBC_01397]WSE19687.1 hypothetical protein OG518_43965 [Streptomyces sp. NBC_01397]